jgi:tetratricopeptide (TPR) repeat protein
MTVAVCMAATVLLFATASGDTTDEIARARSLEADGRPEVAVELLRALVTDGSRDPAPALLLELARLTESPDETLELVDRVLRTTRDAGLRARAHVMRADYLYAAGLYEKAVVEYAAAAERGGAPDDAALRYAASLLETGDTVGAAEAYASAAGSGSADIAAWAGIGRGRALLVGGDAESAADELELVADELAGGPLRAQALAAAAEARVALGELERARALLGLLVEEFPGSFEATLAVARARVLSDRMKALEEEPAAGTAGTDGAEEAPAEPPAQAERARELEGE